MVLLSEIEFIEMERLLADLLASASGSEEQTILLVHARLKAILESQQDLRGTKAHLLSLTARTEQ